MVPIPSLDYLEALCDHPAAYGSEDKREGLVVKVGERELTARYKMVRTGYVQGSRWDPERLVRQSLA